MSWTPAWDSRSPRARWIQAVTIAACVLGLLASAPLWCNSRAYPRVPVAENFPALPPPWDAWFLGGLVLALLLVPFFGRRATLPFLVGSAFLVMGDQTRLQPWFYLYWVLLALTLAPEAPGLTAMRCVISAVYVWSAVQKINAGFVREMVPFFVQPLAAWMPAPLQPVARAALLMAPAIELFIGLALWFRGSRRHALACVALLHGVVLLILGPLGHGQNHVVWPWNLAMVCLVVVLFAGVPAPFNWRELRSSPAASAGVALVCLLPAFSFFGWWDSYLSFALYSGNLARADMYVTPALADRLPPQVQRVLVPVRHDPAREGQWMLNHQAWCAQATRVPPLPEPRAYRVVARHIARFAPATNDFHLVLVSRGGSTNHFDASDFR